MASWTKQVKNIRRKKEEKMIKRRHKSIAKKIKKERAAPGVVVIN